MIDPSQIMIIATGPHGFPGAGQIMCQLLREFSSEGCFVTYVGTTQPFLFKFVDSRGVNFRYVNPFSAGAVGSGKAIGSEDVLLTYRLTTCMVAEILKHAKSYQYIVLWGTYLFPYGHAALMAKECVASKGISTDLWLTPAGSDIWEVGPQLTYVTEQILENSSISHIITYTAQFACEIAQRYQLNRTIESIYPIIDFSRFRSISEDERRAVRARLNIPNECFVITSHSNMRPVKAPEDVIYIANSAAEKIRRKVLLLMVGPVIDNVIKANRLCSNLELLNTGTIEHVEEYLWASDVELNCSWHDSFNVSLAEAMACGVPCISTDVVGIAPEIRASKCGFLFPYESPKEYGLTNSHTRYEEAIQNISILAEAEALRRQMGRNASEHAKKIFSSHHIIPSYFNLINNSKIKGYDNA